MFLIHMESCVSNSILTSTVVSMFQRRGWYEDWFNWWLFLNGLRPIFPTPFNQRNLLWFDNCNSHLGFSKTEWQCSSSRDIGFRLKFSANPQFSSRRLHSKIFLITLIANHEILKSTNDLDLCQIGLENILSSYFEWAALDSCENKHLWWTRHVVPVDNICRLHFDKILWIGLINISTLFMYGHVSVIVNERSMFKNGQ